VVKKTAKQINEEVIQKINAGAVATGK
jgi:hypothetical protein